MVRDLTVRVALEGDFTDAHVTGDNSDVIATDTMKNTVYAMAKDGLTGSIEAFGTLLAGPLPAPPPGPPGHHLDPGARLGPDRRRRLAAPDAFLRNGLDDPDGDRGGARRRA